MSGARLDRGELELALGELEIPELNPDLAFEWSPALFDARATVLEDLGRTDEAAFWRERAEVASAALGHGDDDEMIIEDAYEDLPDDPQTGDSQTDDDAAPGVPAGDDAVDDSVAEEQRSEGDASVPAVPASDDAEDAERAE
jgi:hypothetical protein